MTPAEDTVALILSAGESRRMGTPKPLLPLGKGTTLERSVTLFTDAGIRDIRVVTGHLAGSIRERLPTLPVTWIHNDRFQEGMLSSIKKGVATIEADRSWIFLLPVDIPLVRPRTLSAMLDARLSTGSTCPVLHPTFMGHRGHPPLISTRLIPGILSWDGPGGLGGFLAGHASGAADIPVIDEFIERDMDTPADYRFLSSALPAYHMPTPSECEAMLSDRSLFAEKTASHCRMVAKLAVYFGETLTACNVSLDIGRITAGALLHDISKGENDHAAAGAILLTEMGYSGISNIVAAHADIAVPEESPLTEAEVVHLADKLVFGDLLVPLSVRFERKLAKYGKEPSARAAILKRWSDAETIAGRIARAVGKSFQEIIDGFPQGLK